MRILLVALVAFILSGCATNFSSLDDPDGKDKSVLIVGDLIAIKSTIRQTIQKEYPDAKISESVDGVFTWETPQNMTARVRMFVGLGMDDANKEIKGFFYTVTVDAGDMRPLIKALRQVFGSSGLRIVRVSLRAKMSITDEIAAMAQNAQACFSSMADAPEFSQLKTKVSFGNVADQPFAMLTDNSRPTPEEKEAIRRWGQAREGCLALQHKVNDALGAASQIQVLLDSLAARQQSLIAQLYLGNLTYGAFAEQRQSLTASFKEAASNIQAELRKEQKESDDRARIAENLSGIAHNIASASYAARISSHPMTCDFGGSFMYCN